MSWSFNGLGKPGAVHRALLAHAEGLTGESRAEFDHAALHIAGLLDAAGANAAVLVNASGWATWLVGPDGVRAQTAQSINVEIKQLGTLFE